MSSSRKRYGIGQGQKRPAMLVSRSTLHSLLITRKDLAAWFLAHLRRGAPADADGISAPAEIRRVMLRLVALVLDVEEADLSWRDVSLAFKGLSMLKLLVPVTGENPRAPSGYRLSTTAFPDAQPYDEPPIRRTQGE